MLALSFHFFLALIEETRQRITQQLRETGHPEEGIKIPSRLTFLYRGIT
jgi:hypothetical protein